MKHPGNQCFGRCANRGRMGYKIECYSLKRSGMRCRKHPKGIPHKFVYGWSWCPDFKPKHQSKREAVLA